MNELLYTCEHCDGLGAVEAHGAELAPCEHCDGEGSVAEAPDCDGCDDEPGDIDSDECFNPYTGGYDDDC